MTDPAPPAMSQPPARARRIFVLGATGTIGRATVRALVKANHEVVCFVRPASGRPEGMLNGAEMRFGDATDPHALAVDGFRGETFNTVISCMASRTGAPKDAWAVDYQAHSNALKVAKDAGVTQFILLSAICVQKPRLAFQMAKLAFEQELMASGLDYSIVRATAFYKSLSGQIERLRRGKPFLIFGDGRGTACKPISDDDLGRYLAECVSEPSRRNRILPIGGPGPAITPREQGERLFDLLGREAKFSQAPVALLDAIIWTLSALGAVVPALREKAELARIGRYYATESMLLLNPATGRYDADATPSTGKDTLFDHYARIVSGQASVERGAHSVF
jgi:divinyl chlorophyllide a 8-vinyl-reductase